MIDLGINIKTDEGIAKADGEIKEWVDKLNNELKDKKIKIEFDIPKGKGKGGGGGVKEISDEYKKELKAMQDAWEKLNEVQRDSSTGDALLGQVRELNERYGIYKGTLSQVASEQDKLKEKNDRYLESLETYKGKLKELEESWRSLSLEEQKGSEGEELLTKLRMLNKEYAGYTGTLSNTLSLQEKSIAQDEKRAQVAETYKGKLQEIEQAWAKLSSTERQGEQGEELLSNLRDLNKEYGIYKGSAKDAVREQDKLAKSLNASAGHINTYKDKLKQLEIAWEQLSASQRRGAEGKQLIRQVKSLNNQYGIYRGTIGDVIQAEKRHEQQMKRSRSTMSSLKGMVMSYISIYSGIRIAKQMAEITGELEMQKAALGAILQDTERANTLFSQIKTLAVISPFEVKDLISYTKQLSAFSIPYNELYETTKRLADISAGLGVDMSRLILAYGQVRSAEVLRGQELRQFTEAGIPLVEELRRKFEELGEEGITTADVFDRIYTRQVPFKMVRDVMFEMSDEGGKFFNMQAIQADTLKGKITNLTDAYNIFLSEIGESASPVLKGFIDFLREAMVYHDSLIKAVQWGATSYAGFRTAVMLANIQLKSLRLTMATMPWGAIAIAISAVAFKIMSAAEATKTLEKFQKELDATMGRLRASIMSEEVGLRLLFTRLKNVEKGSKDYLLVKNEIVRKYGDYMEGLDDEIEKTKDYDGVLKELLKSFMAYQNAKAASSFTESAEASYAQVASEAWKKVGEDITKVFGGDVDVAAPALTIFSDWMQKALSGEVEITNQTLRELEDQIIKEIEETRKSWNKKVKDALGADMGYMPVRLFKWEYKDQGYIDGLTKLTRDLKPKLEELKGAHTILEDMKKTSYSLFGTGIDPNKYKGKDKADEEILNINKLLDRRTKLLKKLEEARKPASSSDWSVGVGAGKDFDKIKDTEKLIDDINSKLKLLGHVDPKDDEPPKPPVETIKEMLNDIKNEIDEYKQRESIYDILKKQGDDFEMDFKFTVGGEPSIAEFIKKQMGEIGGSDLNLDLDFKTATFEDMMKGVDLSKIYPNEADQKLAMDALYSWFQELRRMSLVEYEDIQKVTDTYASYVDKKRELDKKYEDEKEKLTLAGADERAFAEQDRVYKEETEKLILLFAGKNEAFTDFLEQIAEESLESLTFLMENLEGELLLSDVFGLDENEAVMIRARIIKLREEIKKTTAEIAKAKKKEEEANKENQTSYARWKKLQTVLGKAQSEFQSLGQTIGGVTGEIISAAGDITASTVSMISGIQLLSENAIKATEETAKSGSKAIDKVEKASVILAIVSASLQILTKIAGFFIKDTQISQEVIDQYNSLVSVINEVTDAQKEMLDALSGREARAQLEKSIDLLKMQRDATIDAGKAFLQSGKKDPFIFMGGKDSYGERLMKRLSKYKKELKAIGIQYEELGNGWWGDKGKGIIDISVEQIELLKQMPHVWAALGSEVQEYLNTLLDVEQRIRELEEAHRESLTGVSFDELKGGLDDFLMSADSTFDDVAKNFEDHMLQAMLRVVKAQYLNNAMEKWYENFAKKMDDGVLSKEDREELEQSYIEMAEKAKLMYDTAVDISGLERSASDNLSGLSKGVAEMTEDTALILGGYLDSIRFKLFPYIDFMMTDYSSTIRIISNAQVQQVNHLSEIESNTRISANKVTELTEMIDSVIEIGSNGRKIRV